MFLLRHEPRSAGHNSHIPCKLRIGSLLEIITHPVPEAFEARTPERSAHHRPQPFRRRRLVGHETPHEAALFAGVLIQ